MITTIMDMSIHVASADLVTVRATMFADPEGHPVFAGTGSAELHQDSDGDVITGVFDLLVAEMRIAGIPGSAWPDEARAVSA